MRDLIRDVLDMQLVDRRNDRMGKVDGLVVEVSDRGQPRVVAIEVGPVTLARRLSCSLERWVAGIFRWFGLGDGVTRFAMSQVRRIAIEVELDVDADTSEVRRVEHWLRDHIVRRIPGSGVKG
jgi:hypothetical protein